MGLLEQEIKELRQMQKDYKAGKLSQETAMTQLAFYSQTEKRANLIIKSVALGAKFGSPALNRIIKTNLIGDGTAIECGDFETEMIKCPDRDGMLIPRNECLDYSGSHNKECSSCDHFKTTRNILLGPKTTGRG